jgi:hypothetical protein
MGITKAMLKQLAAMAVIPPSPKRRAWITRATEIAINAAQGPRRMATMTPPTAWPVDPPGMGMLNIMITKLKAEPKARKGTWRCLRLRRTILEARAQMGTMTP